MGNNFAKFQAMENAWEKKVEAICHIIGKAMGKQYP